ncbi:Oxidized polyvinyl alcohol hydrolase precursor [Planctomycetes bacterium Pan216]|uniref:Oxidized polyvinyl alcohol hydrolase n=1 Tax=Kolteria novifilia TaxID=2527975 RepID=A0A518B2F2_9BACT|nr:Oxidized polyvinyl alcohol hydrolase precursor [Planctomycetes bacterium Pan216]
MLLLALLVLLAEEALGPGDHRFDVSVDGRKRFALVHVPPQAKKGQPLPLVLAFHGAATNAHIMANLTEFNAKADKEGFIVAYPNGTGRTPWVGTWNAGRCCGHASKEGIDDVGFVETLLDRLAQRVSVDPRRIYATGISNGAMMSYRLACELPERIAAIAPVSGPIVTDECPPGRPVPVMHFHGTKDHFAPYDVSKNKLSRLAGLRSVDDTIALWVERNDCERKPTETKLPDRVDDGTRVTRFIYVPKKGDGDVILYRIEGGGHSWPGGTRDAKILGKTSREISANDLMWAFFKGHPLPKQSTGKDG